jgi:hypothetical protein
MPGMHENYLAQAVQIRLRARAKTAASPRERAIWTRLAIVHQLVGRKRLAPEAVKGIAFFAWLRETGRVGGPVDGARQTRRRPPRVGREAAADTASCLATIAESGPQSTGWYLGPTIWSDGSAAPGLGLRARRRRRRSAPSDVLIVRCDTQQHRVGLPSRGPIVLFDHPDRASVDAALERPGEVAGCAKVLLYVRGRASYNSYGWWKWGVHVAPSFGPSGWAIRDRLKESDQRRTIRRLLRDVDLE